MKWEIIMTVNAQKDLEQIYKNIRYVLAVPVTARKQTDRITEKISDLSDFPKMYPENENGIRKMTVDNYLVFYDLDESRGSVIILRIVYGGIDLNNMSL